jgi:hypothetical protein
MLQFKQQCCELLQREHPAMSNRRLSFTAAGYIIPALYALYLSSSEHTALRTSKTHGTQDIKDTRNSGHQRHMELRTSKTHTNRILVDYTYQDYERISSSRPLQATSIPYFTTPSRRTEQPTHTTRSHRNQSTSNL